MPDQDLRTVTKRELVNRIAEETGQTKVVVRDVLQRFLDSVIDELSEGNRLEFRDFGVFEVRERAARVAQNPRTLEKVPVPAKRVVKFKVGRVMRQRVCDEIESTDGSEGGRNPRASGGPSGQGSTVARPAGASSSGGGARSAGSSQANGAPAKVAGPRGVHLGAQGARPFPDQINGSKAAEDRVEPEERKPQPPTPPPSKPGSPF